jgi:hypothetical protein
MNAQEINQKIRDIKAGEGTHGDKMAEAIRFLEENGIAVVLPETAFKVYWDIIPVPETAQMICIAVSGNALERNLYEDHDKHWNVLELFATSEMMKEAGSIHPVIARHVVMTGPGEIIHRPGDLLAGQARRMAVMTTRYPVFGASDTVEQSDLIGRTPTATRRERGAYGC